MTAEEAAWLGEYENRTARGQGQSTAVSIGASAAGSRKVSHHYTEEEHQAVAVGTGSAAELAASAVMVREEGRRLDSIVDRGINALVRAVEAYEKMTAALLKERQEDAKTHRALLDSLRSHFLARAEAEANLIHQEAHAAAKQAENEDGGFEREIEKALAKQMVSKFAGAKEEPTSVDSKQGAASR